MTPKQRRKNRRTYWIGTFVASAAMMLINLGKPFPPGTNLWQALLMLAIIGSASFGVGYSIAWLNGFDAGFNEGSGERG
jgi:hypothetical protein